MEARSGDLSIYLYLPRPSGTRVVFPINGEITWTFDAEDRWCTFRGWSFDFVRDLCNRNQRPLTDNEIHNWQAAREGGENPVGEGEAHGVGNPNVVADGGADDVAGAVEDIFIGDTFDPLELEEIERLDGEQRESVGSGTVQTILLVIRLVMKY